MTDRLTLAEAQERARSACARAGILIDWSAPHDEADRMMILYAMPRSNGANYQEACLEVGRILRAYARHLDSVAGAQSERANAVALLRQRARDILDDGGIADAPNTLQEAAILIERSNRAEQGVKMPPRAQVAPAAHAAHHVGLKHTGPYGCGDRSCRICFG